MTREQYTKAEGIINRLYYYEKQKAELERLKGYDVGMNPSIRSDVADMIDSGVYSEVIELLINHADCEIEKLNARLDEI